MVTRGRSLADKPIRPAVRFPTFPAGQSCAERLGKRTSKYTVLLSSKGQQAYACDLPEKVWRDMADSSAWKGKVGMVTNSLDCASLVPQK